MTVLGTTDPGSPGFFVCGRLKVDNNCIVTLGFCTDMSWFSSPLAARCDLVLLPELVDGGYAALANGKGTHRTNSPFLQRWKSMTRQSRTIIAAGSVRLDHGDNDYTNTALVYWQGRQILRYDKIHMFPLTNDSRYFRSGTRTPVARITVKGNALRLGVIICYDLRFPELPRILARKGVDLLLVPARWPRERNDAWRTLLKARAIENQIFVAGCNASGKEGGPSYMFDPAGTMVRPESGSPQGWKWYHVDTKKLTKTRKLFVLRD